MDATFDHRRRGDKGYAKTVERILLWVALATAVATGATKYGRMLDAVEKAEDAQRRVTIVETRRDVDEARSEERWKSLWDRLDRMERKLDRGIR